MIIYSLYVSGQGSVESPLKPKPGLNGAPVICYPGRGLLRAQRLHGFDVTQPGERE